jgi:hypothetical protein
MKQYLKLLNKSWSAMIFIEILLIAMFYVLTYYYYLSNEPILSKGYSVTFSYVLMLVMVLCVFLGGKGINRKIKNLVSLPLPEKLEKYRMLQIKRLRFYSLVNIVALIGLFFCNQTSFLLFSIISVLLTLLSKVSELKLKMELSLSEEEIENMEKLKFEKI